MATTGMNLNRLSEEMAATAPQQAQTALPVRPQPPTDTPAAPSWWDTVGLIKDREWAVADAARFIADGDIQTDLGDWFPKEQEYLEMTAGLDEATRTRLAEVARSDIHLRVLISEAQEENRILQEVGRHGALGVATHLGVSILDPSFLLLAAAGPTAIGSKASRLRAAAGNLSTAEARARAAALAEQGGQGIVATRAAQGAIIAGTEGFLTETLDRQTNATTPDWAVALGTVAGAALGGSIMGALGRSEARRVNDMAENIKRHIGTLEAEEAVASQRAALRAELGDVDAARASVAQADTRAAGHAASINGDLSQYNAVRHALESGGNANARATGSSAVGIDQFTEGTWLSVVSRSKPEWAKGLSREQLLALRTNPQRSAEMVEVLNKANEAALRRADAPVNVFTMYATHHFGERRGVMFAKAPPTAKMSALLSETQIKANPYLANLTKSEALANWEARVRRAGVDTDGFLQGMAPATARLRAETEGFDEGAVRLELEQADAAVKALDDQFAQMTAEAKGALPQGQMRKLEREIEGLRAEQRKGFKTGLGEVQRRMDAIKAKLDEIDGSRLTRLDRMRDEDFAKMGDIAGHAQYEKLRTSAVDESIKRERKQWEKKAKDAKFASQKKGYATRERLRELTEVHKPAAAARDASLRLREALKADPRAAHQAQADKLRQALGLQAERTATLSKAEAEAADVVNHRKAVGETRSKLEKLDGGEKLGTQLSAMRQSMETGDYRGGFGGDTLSAARAWGYDTELFPGKAEGTHADVAQTKMASAQRLMGVGTFSGILRGSEHAVVRSEFGRLVGNTLGNADDSVNELGASEISAVLQRRFTADFNRAITQNYDKWIKSSGRSWLRKYQRDTRALFNAEIGAYLRAPHLHKDVAPEIKDAAGRVQQLWMDILKEAKDAGVKGFENVQPDAHWMPRVFNHHALAAMMNKYGDSQVLQLVQGAIRSANPDFDDKLTKMLSTNYLKRMRELRMGSDANDMNGMSWDDVGFLRNFLEEAGTEQDEINVIVDKFKQAMDKRGNAVMKQEGDFRNAKKRQSMDEAYVLKMRPKDGGEPEEIAMHDLFENNVESLAGRYIRSMSGHIALRKAGFADKADFNARIKRVQDELEQTHPDDAKKAVKYAQAAHDIITGRPLEDATLWTEITRTARDVAYALQMENAGLASIPDLASLLSWGNLRHTMNIIGNPREMVAMWRRDGDMNLVNETMRELEEAAGIGTDFLNNQIYSSYDVADEYANAALKGGNHAQRVAGAFASLSHAARVGGRAVTAGSGLGAISTFAQRIAARNMLYRMKDEVFKGGEFSQAKAASLGIDPAMKKRIETQMRKHTEWVEGDTGGKIQRVNFNKWDDLDARDKLLYSVTREAKKNVQEEDLGDTFMWQHKSIGKLLSQFRRFGIVSYTKQTLRGLAERDAETATRVALQSTLAAMVYGLRHEITAAGMEMAGTDQEKIDDYRQLNLAPNRYVAAAIRNSGWATMAPDAYDMTAGKATGQPFFDVRNSGNSSGFAFPAYAVGDNATTFLSGLSQAALRDDRQVTQGVISAGQAIAPFGNYLLTAPAFQAFKEQFPKSHEDDDPDNAEWSFL